MKTASLVFVIGVLFGYGASYQIRDFDQDSSYALPIVRTSKGTVQGSVILTDRGNVGYGFQGVPFAATTGGSNRFKPPVARDPWEGVLNATKYGPKCWQIASLFDSFLNSSSSEDCLTVNIYTPHQNLSEDSGSIQLYPIVYYILGGAWQGGDPSQYNVEPFIDNFASRGVIVVFVNYRTNVFGGFTTGSANAPGNLGLRDTIAGLQWVQDEISAFGGDANRVTIQGESSGGEAVSLLTLSPLTEGLFNQAAPMSGSGVYHNSLKNGSEIDAFYQLASTLGCNDYGEWYWAQETVLSCMQNISAARVSIAFALSGQTNAANPRIDGSGGVLPEAATTLAAKRRPLRFLTGTTAKEAILFMGIPDINSTINSSNSTNTIARCDSLASSRYPDASSFVADACKTFYGLEELKQNHSDSEHKFWFDTTVDLVDGNQFFSQAFGDANAMRKAGSDSIFLYSFDYVKKGLEGLAPWHAMDLWHIFDLPVTIMGVDLTNKTEEDLQMDEIYSTIFCNFAKYGNPTPLNISDDDANNTSTFNSTLWNPLASPVGYNYFSIDLNPRNMPFYHYKDVMFWNDIAPMLASSEQKAKSQNGGRRGRDRAALGRSDSQYDSWPFNQLSQTDNYRKGPFFGQDQFDPFGPFGVNPWQSQQRNTLITELLQQYQEDATMKDFIQRTVIKTKANNAKSIPSSFLSSSASQSQSSIAADKSTSAGSGSTVAVWAVVGALVGIVGLAGAALFVNLRRRKQKAEKDESIKFAGMRRDDETDIFSRASYSSID